MFFERVKSTAKFVSVGFDGLSKDYEMYRIKDYIVTQPFMLQSFGLMNVTVRSTDTENPVLLLSGIPASDLIETIREYVQ